MLFSTMAGNTFFLSAYGTLTKTDPVLIHKTSLNQAQKIEMIKKYFQNLKDTELEIIKYM